MGEELCQAKGAARGGWFLSTRRFSGCNPEACVAPQEEFSPHSTANLRLTVRLLWPKPGPSLDSAYRNP